MNDKLEIVIHYLINLSPGLVNIFDMRPACNIKVGKHEKDDHGATHEAFRMIPTHECCVECLEQWKINDAK